MCNWPHLQDSDFNPRKRKALAAFIVFFFCKLLASAVPAENLSQKEKQLCSKAFPLFFSDWRLKNAALPHPPFSQRFGLNVIITILLWYGHSCGHHLRKDWNKCSSSHQLEKGLVKFSPNTINIKIKMYARLSSTNFYNYLKYFISFTIWFFKICLFWCSLYYDIKRVLFYFRSWNTRLEARVLGNKGTSEHVSPNEREKTNVRSPSQESLEARCKEIIHCWTTMLGPSGAASVGSSEE